VKLEHLNVQIIHCTFAKVMILKRFVHTKTYFQTLGLKKLDSLHSSIFDVLAAIVCFLKS
jgi:hypothetical protein